MKIEILGCNGSVMPGYNTTSILVDGRILIDAGSAASVLPEEAVCALRHIMITHTHMDHIKELPFALDTMFSHGQAGVTIWGSRETIDVLTRHIFNSLIWPEIKDYNTNKKFIEFREVPGERFEVEGLFVESFPVEHIPGSRYYMFSEGNGRVLFSGDTGYDERLFDLVGSLGADLKAFFVDVSFPNRMEGLALISRHLTPSLLEKGIMRRISPAARVVAYHIKPKYLDEVVAELPPNVAYITGGEVFEF